MLSSKSIDGAELRGGFGGRAVDGGITGAMNLLRAPLEPWA